MRRFCLAVIAVGLFATPGQALAAVGDATITSATLVAKGAVVDVRGTLECGAYPYVFHEVTISQAVKKRAIVSGAAFGDNWTRVPCDTDGVADWAVTVSANYAPFVKGEAIVAYKATVDATPPDQYWPYVYIDASRQQVMRLR